MRRAAAAGLLTLALGACTGDGREPPAAAPTTPPASTPSTNATVPASAAWSLDAIRVDRVPANLPQARTALPRRFPADDAALPDLLTDPPGRAVLAQHPRESFDDQDGWSSERLFFLGVDGGWRSLELADLGIPESAWPGPDTYGAGDLSPNGRLWAGPTNDGIVLVDLGTGRARTVAIPGTHPGYVADWRPDSRRLDVVRFSGKSTYRTWWVDPGTVEVARAPYRLSFGGYAPDGSVVTFAARDGGTVRITHRDGVSTREKVRVPYRYVRYGALVGPTHTVLGLPHSSVAVDGPTMAPIARLAAPAFTIGWLDASRVLFALGHGGLMTWDVGTGVVKVLTRAPPAARRGAYWTVSVASDLIG